MPIKGKQLIDNSVDLKKLNGGVKLLSNTSLLGSNKTPSEITDNNEFTTKEYVDLEISKIEEESTTAGNGLSINGNEIILGGSLNQNTTINGSNFNLNFSNLDTFNLTTNNDINLTSNSSNIILNGTNGNVKINGLNYPLSDSTSGSVLKTDGNGNLTLEEIVLSDTLGNIINTTSNYTVTTNDYIIKCDTTNNDIVINLPNESTSQKFTINIWKKVQKGKITVNPSSGNINGEANLIINNKNSNATLFCDGTNWIII